MIIFNYIFFSIYKSISITNNWWPKKSTISAITVLLYFNLLTIVAFLNEEILKIKILFFFFYFYNNLCTTTLLLLQKGKASRNN